MDIVILNDNAHVTGGGGKVALGSAKGLARRGHRVSLMTAVGPVAPDLVGVRGLEVICTGQQEILTDPNRVRAAVQGYWNRTTAAALSQLLSRLDPAATVVHLHTWGKALTSSVLRATIDANFPLICTLHDYALACPTGGLFHHRREEICQLRPMSTQCLLTNCDTRNYGHKLWRFGRELVQIGPGRVPGGIRHFIALSRLSLEVMKPFLPADAEIHFVPNFTEAQRGAPVPVDRNNRFVFVGRLVREKGPHLFAECARRLDLNAVFIGDGEFRNKVLELYPKAVVTGWIGAQQVTAQMEQARALVFASLWYEVQPLAILEAAAMGIPAIVPDTSAARELIVDGETGLLFRGGSADSLMEALAVMQDPATASRLGGAAHRRFWSRPLTLDFHLDELEAVYTGMLAGDRMSAAVAN
ncbi:MAG TPA: glycosyltransferase family 4 protein [Bryobacteraceae bacterium]|nr:glycosyltransferase family 4 protein [Bryobacteraceae bacterium]